MGLLLLFFLIEHLLTNSQAALFIGKDGGGFIDAVNWIHSLPYLPFIELALLAIPFFIHGAWGINYLFTAKPNSYGNTGKDPYLPNYPRNHFYTWQRITSWILLLGVILHVAQMRFLRYPTTAKVGSKTHYIVKVEKEPGIYTLSERLNVDLLDSRQLEKKELDQTAQKYGKRSIEGLQEAQKVEQQKKFGAALAKWKVGSEELAAVTPDAGTAFLLNIRSVMFNPWMRILYTVFVACAAYHAFNGLWTFLITWGVTLSARSQKLSRFFATGLMIAFGILGFAAIWITSLVNIRS